MAKNETINKTVDMLAKKKGYPAVKLSYSVYVDVLEESHKLKYQQNEKTIY
jgi:hypothetical protein